MTQYDGLARLSIVKAVLNITADTYDDDLRGKIRAASRAFERETARNLLSQTYTDERYTAFPNTTRLYLRNWPVTTFTRMKFDTTIISATTYDLINADSAPYILYEGVWTQADSMILCTFTAGYDVTGWASLGINLDSGDVFNVPADMEDAIAEYAAMLWLKSVKSGQARIGIASVNRGGESLSYERYVQGFPDSFKSAVERYARYA